MSYAKLRGKIIEKYHTAGAFADALDINRATMSAKLNNRSQWTAPEIAEACKLLDIPLTEAHSYFFCTEGCNNATE